MEDYLMHGEENSRNATEDNETVVDLNDDIGGELENIVDCGFDYEDFEISYKAIETAVGDAGFDYTFYDFKLCDDLENTLDDIDNCYYWFKHTKDKNDRKDIKHDWEKDMKNIKGYVEDYNKSCNGYNYDPDIFLDL